MGYILSAVFRSIIYGVTNDRVLYSHASESITHRTLDPFIVAKDWDTFKCFVHLGKLRSFRAGDYSIRNKSFGISMLVDAWIRSQNRVATDGLDG